MSFGNKCNVNGEILEEVMKLKELVASLGQEAVGVPIKDG